MSAAFFSGRFDFATNVSSPIEKLSLSDTAAAVAPPEDAVLHTSVLPLTQVSTQSTVTPVPMLQSPAETPAGELMTAANAEPTPAPTPEPVYIIYTVQDGDTIDGLAGRYGISPASIVWNNLDLESADMLVVGQYLQIPMSDGIIYEIRMGDTLSDIAARFSVDLAAITGFAGNHLANSDGIAENQVIFVPGGTMPAPPPPPTETPVPPRAEERPANPPAESPPPPADAGPSSSSGFIWPVHGPISSYFSRGHPLGIDIDQYNSPGAPILAAASGVVTFAGGNSCCSYGLYVVVNHQNGFETLYAHMSSIAVAQGQYVNQGEVLGYVGLTGYSTGYHLHFEMRLNGSLVNPLNYLP